MVTIGCPGGQIGPRQRGSWGDVVRVKGGLIHMDICSFGLTTSSRRRCDPVNAYIQILCFHLNFTLWSSLT